MIRQVVTAMVMAAAFAAQVRADEVCIKASELEADQTRFVETQLRVAAQQCGGGKNIDLPDLYTSFVLEKRPYLARSEAALQAYVKRQGGQALEDYLTAVASRVSYASAQVSQFCTKSRLAAEASVKTGTPTILLSLLPVPYERPAALCTG